MRINLLVAFFIALISTSMAQLKINSPYSRFGVGDIKDVGLTQNRGMAGVGASLGHKLFLNNVNPAILNLNDYTIYDVGISNSARTLESSNSSSSNGDLNLDYLALSVPITPKTQRWTAGAGLNQYSQVSYDIATTQAINDVDYIDYNYKGSGGINRFFLTNAYRVLDDTSSHTIFALGLEMSYLFGQIASTQSSQLFEQGTSIGQVSSFREDNSYSNTHFKYGLSFRKGLHYFTESEILKSKSGADSLVTKKHYSFKDMQDKTMDQAIVGEHFIIYPGRKGVRLEKTIRNDEDIDRLLQLFKGLSSTGYGVFVKKSSTELSNRDLRKIFVDLIDKKMEEKAVSNDDIDFTSKFTRKQTGVYVNAGLAYDMKTNLSGSSLRIIERTTSSGNYISLDTLVNGSSTSLTLPSSIVAGISIDKPNVTGSGGPSIWGVGADLTLTNWKEFKDESFSNYTNTYKVALGGYYCPNIFSKGLKKLFYRAGIHYGSSPFSINETSFNDIGINFGTSLPLGKFGRGQRPNYINLAMNLGQRGTTDNNLIKEKYAIVSVSFSFNSLWFQRYKLGL